MKLVFFGTPSFVVPVLEKLHQKYDIIAVVTSPDKKIGRKQQITPSPVKQFAVQHTIPVFEDLKIENFKLKITQPDLFVVAAYGKIIPQTILDIPTLGAVNIHPSLLPKYRGSSPLAEALKNGDVQTGISFMVMDEKMDHGSILKQVIYTIDPSETFETLAENIFNKSAELLPEVIDDYVAGKIKLAPQDDSRATYTKLITKQDGYIDLQNPPTKEEIARKIRAYYPWPTVWGELETKNGQRKIIKLLPNNTIQMEGKNPITIKDFLNGYPEAKKILTPLFE